MSKVKKMAFGGMGSRPSMGASRPPVNSAPPVGSSLGAKLKQTTQPTGAIGTMGRGLGGNQAPAGANLLKAYNNQGQGSGLQSMDPNMAKAMQSYQAQAGQPAAPQPFRSSFGPGMKKGGDVKTKKYAKGGDVQSESSKLEQKNEAMDKAQEEGRKRYEKQEEEDNKAPRKAVGEAIDYVKEKASKFGKDFVEGAKQYGETYKKGLGMKSGGSVKSASARADGCAIRGKTRA